MVYWWTIRKDEAELVRTRREAADKLHPLIIYSPFIICLFTEEMTVKTKENLLRVIRRDNPQWVPDGMEGVVRIGPPVTERPATAGYDAFGVHWSYEAGAEGGTYPTVDGHTIDDIRHWREQLSIPDVSVLDWRAVEIEAQAVDSNVIKHAERQIEEDLMSGSALRLWA